MRQFVVQRLAASEQAPRMLQHQLALPGQAKFAAAALDQLAVKVTLQSLDAAAERRLTEVDRLGGATEVAVISEGDQMAKLAKIHHASPAFCGYF